jgi:hypothetical protein
MKKLINDPADVVKEALLGIAAAHPELKVDHANKVIYRGDAPKRRQGGPDLGWRLRPRTVPPAVARIKQRVREVDLAHARALAEKALTCESASDVRALVSGGRALS